MELLSFATDLLDALGGVVERDGEDAFRVLLAPDLAARAGLPEEARLLAATAATDGGADGVPLGHGSEVVQRLVGEALGAGRLATLAADVDPPRAKNVEAALAEALRPANGTARIEEVLPGNADYLVVGFRYCATGDERREGMVDVAVSPDGTATAAGLPEILWSNEHVLRETRTAGGAPIAPPAWRAAALLARRRVVDALAPVREIVAHRLERDVLRLHGYYRAMQEEVLRSAARRGLAGPEAEKVLARANGIPPEFHRRVAEARARLALRVVVRPAVAVLVSVPALFVRVRLLRRKEERELLLRCDGLQRAFEVPLCEGCGAVAVSAPMLCDDHVHLLCDDCFWTCPACGARTCLACLRRCRKCGARPGAPAPQAAATAPSAAPARQSSPLAPAATETRTSSAPPAAADARPGSSPPPLPASSGRPAAPPPPKAATPPPAEARSPSVVAPAQVPSPAPSRRPPPPPVLLRIVSPGSPQRRGTARQDARLGTDDGGAASLPNADRRGARALARMAETLGQAFAGAAPEERIREALRSLGQAGTTALVRHTGLPADVVRRAVQDLRARGEVVHAGHGRGTEYRLA